VHRLDVSAADLTRLVEIPKSSWRRLFHRLQVWMYHLRHGDARKRYPLGKEPYFLDRGDLLRELCCCGPLGGAGALQAQGAGTAMICYHAIQGGNFTRRFHLFGKAKDFSIFDAAIDFDKLAAELLEIWTTGCSWNYSGFT
jgi:hypothetical protein